MEKDSSNKQSLRNIEEEMVKINALAAKLKTRSKVSALHAAAVEKIVLSNKLKSQRLASQKRVNTLKLKRARV